MDEVDAYKSTIDTLCDIIRAIGERVPEVVDEVLNEHGIEIEYDAVGEEVTG